MDHVSETILATPVLSVLKRRPYYGKRKPSDIRVMRDLQRLIKTATKNRRVMSVNKLGERLRIDPHLLTRILNNTGYPEMQKAITIAAFFGKQVAVVDAEG